MNHPPHQHFNSEEFKQYLLSKQGKGPLYAFLLSSATIFLIFLITVLKPHRLYKKLIGFLFGITITIKGFQYKLHHFLLLITLFYGSLFFFLLMQSSQNKPTSLDPYRIKMQKLDKKWVLESQSWLAFLICICLLSIYRNSKLFNSEETLKKQIEEYDKELKNKNKKNE